MNILVAPDSFKGSMTALEVANNIEKGILRVFPYAEITKVPMADGGEGTVQSLVDASDGKIIKTEVTGPLGENVEAEFGLLGKGDTAVIEMASASGLPLVSDEKANPAKTTTYGTGELIKKALDKGARELIIGIGGSATNDAGVGLAQALGVHFLDEKGEEIGFGGGQLYNIEKIDMKELDPRIKRTNIRVACDVNNPLYGPDGAAYVYAPQKGADPEMVKQLDENLRHFSRVVESELGKDIKNIPGAGAAGGLGAGLVAFLDAKLMSGIEIVLKENKIEEKMKDSDLVITGEGKIDGQTINGKTPIGIARKAKKYEIPVIAIAGMIGDDAAVVLEEGIDVIYSIVKGPLSLETAIKQAPRLTCFISEQIMRTVKIGGNGSFV